VELVDMTNATTTGQYRQQIIIRDRYKFHSKEYELYSQDPSYTEGRYYVEVRGGRIIH